MSIRHLLSAETTNRFVNMRVTPLVAMSLAICSLAKAKNDEQTQPEGDISIRHVHIKRPKQYRIKGAP